MNDIHKKTKKKLSKITCDFEKRAFLKALGTLGVGLFVWSLLLPKKANALIFGSATSRISGANDDIETLQDQVETLENPDETTKKLYSSNQGATFIVSGPKITSSDPPQRAAQTQARIDEYTAMGIPENNILWNVVGESDE